MTQLPVGKKRTVLVVGMLLLTLFAAAQPKAEREIRQTMALQSDAWNRGDLNAFMQPYWQSDSLVFVGSKGPVYGWQNTLSNYQRSYNGADLMGQLTFDLLRLKPLGKKHYQVIGKWSLKRKAGDIGGYFSLVFEKINGRWIIIADHSS